MRIQARHLQRGTAAPRGSRALALCAAVLLGVAATGVVGTGFLSTLDRERAPLRVGSIEQSDPAGRPDAVDPTAIPAERAGDPLWAVLVADPLTQLTASPAAECTPVSLGDGSENDDELERRLNDVAQCFDAMWRPSLEAHGIDSTPVAVELRSPATGACTAIETPIRAAYCAPDRTISIDPAAARHQLRDLQDGQQLLIGIIAHEHAHHLQAVSGLLDRTAAITTAHPESAREVTRRLETMAICLGSTTHAAASPPLPLTQGYAEHSTDPHTYSSDTAHGAAASQAQWARRGLNTPGRGAACATFSAPAALVA